MWLSQALVSGILGCFLLEAGCTNNLGEGSCWHEEGEGLEEEHKKVTTGNKEWGTPESC